LAADDTIAIGLEPLDPTVIQTAQGRSEIMGRAFECSMLLACLLAQIVHADDAALLTSRREVLEQAWRDRSERLWDVAIDLSIATKMSRQAVLGPERTRKLPPAIEFVDAFTKAEFRLQGAQFSLLERTAPSDFHSVVPSRHVTYDGETSRYLSGSFPADARGVGIVSKTPADFLKTWHYIPLRMHAWPLEEQLGGIDMGSLHPRIATETFNGRECEVWETLGTEHPIDNSYWVDPLRGFVLLRYMSMVEGRPSIEMEVEHKETPHGWTPTEWAGKWLNEDGSVLYSSHVTVTRFEVNPKLTTSLWSIRECRGLSG
jgi:hypothetical protein